jgi:hypothetical protein
MRKKSTRIRNLGELQKHVNALTKRHGETASCCAWILTRDDFVTIDDTGKDAVVDANTAKSMMMDIDAFEYSFIEDHLQRIVGNELTSRNL